jgi:hypothetical protein
MSVTLSLAALMATAAPLAGACGEIAGLEQLLRRPGLNFLLIGEYHGTVEMPALAADIVCHGTTTRRPLVLGVELAPADQPALDRYMASKGGARARAALLASPAWKEAGGRSTSAIADLVEAARQLGKKHEVRVVAFDTAPEPGTSPKREAAMADALMAAAKGSPGSLVIAFTGAGHADKEGWTSRNPPFLAAGGLLPREQTISLTFARVGGQYWGCAAPDGDRSRGCTAYDMPVREPVAPRAILLDPKIRNGFDGIYHPGRQYTASRPALSK